jgi:hypothetical protein
MNQWAREWAQEHLEHYSPVLKELPVYTVQDVLDVLPRSGRRFPNAVVWLDAAGRLNVEVVGGGVLLISEDESNDGLFRMEVDDSD